MNAESTPATMGGVVPMLTEYGPRVLSVLAIIIIGIVGSMLARRFVRWGVEKSGLDALLERVGISKLLYKVGIKENVPRLLGQLAWYTGLLLTLSVLSETLGLPGLADGIAVITAYLPTALAAAVILLGGFFLADLAQKTLDRVTASREDINAPKFVGKAAYYAVLILAGTMAADHLGFETRLINSIIETAIQASLFGVALAFALGAGGSFKHVVARFYAERIYRPGDRVTIDGIEGTVIRFGAAQALIETDDGKEIIVPAQSLMDSIVGLERIEAQGDKPAQPEAPIVDPEMPTMEPESAEPEPPKS